MERFSGNAFALLLLAAVLVAPLPAQQASGSDLEIEPAAMGALKKMGAYLRTLDSFQVRSESTSEEVLTNGEKLQFAQTAKRPSRQAQPSDGRY